MAVIHYLMLFVGVVHISGILGDIKRPVCDEIHDSKCRLFKKRNRLIKKFVDCVPKGTDAKCMIEGMKAVLNGKLNAVKCKRGECPKGSTSIKGNCCYKSSEPTPVCGSKPGTCPLVAPSNIDCSTVKVARMCETDSDCDGDLKCCTLHSCGGTSCIKPGSPITNPKPKPGLCPSQDYVFIDCSTIEVIQECEFDHDCSGNHKCCVLDMCSTRKCMYAQPIY